MGSLEHVNDTFRLAYARARERTEGDGPVFVLLGDDLIVFRDDRRLAYRVRPRRFHTIKAVSHAPIAFHTILHPLAEAKDSKLDEETERALARLREQIVSAEGQIRIDLASEETTAQIDCERVLRDTLASLDRFVRDRSAEARHVAHEATALARQVGPLLLRLTEHATKIHLDELDRHVNDVLATMTTAERAALRVVVTGDHQARRRSLGMLYFEDRLPTPKDGVERVIYGEGISDEKEALALVGIQRLDRIIAKAFFGDEHRLQRDVLGDAAAALLAKAALEPIR